MHYAKSAKVAITLGATLVAMSLQSMAAMSGSNINGIDAGNTAGIDAGNALGIDAGNALGIDAGNALGIDAGNALGIDAGGVLLTGPVDAIDRLNGVFESMGQVVMASQGMLADLQVGAFVAVEGTVISSGWYFADAVNVSDQMYIPGATEVFVSGMISSVNQMNGTAQMGGLTIDYTPSLGGSSAPSGEMWSFRGTRPSQGGMMISDRSSGAGLR